MFSKILCSEIYYDLIRNKYVGSRMVTLNIVLCFLEFPVGSVSEVGPYEQSKATAACFGQKWLPVASCVPLRIQGVAASKPAEDDAPQSRELHAE